jgi:hypothetical protein
MVGSRATTTRSAPPGVPARRQQLRVLDGCLDVLEDAHERGDHLVGSSLAARLEPFVKGIGQGMHIVKAIDLVLKEQEPYLTTPGKPSRHQGHARPSPSSRGDVRVRDICLVGHDVPDTSLDVEEARALTDRIKVAARDLSRLLLEAHDRRAWTALGYATWTEYVGEELGLSKQRAFQLLDHARFIFALDTATGRPTGVALPERVSRDLKPHLGPVIEMVRSRTAGAADVELPRIVERVAREERHRVVELRVRRQTRTYAMDGAVAGRGPAKDPVEMAATLALLHRLTEALRTLAQMPPSAEVLGIVPEDYDFAVVDRAAAWLAGFTRARVLDWVDGGHTGGSVNSHIAPPGVDGRSSATVQPFTDADTEPD